MRTIKTQFDKKMNDATLSYENKILREVVEGKRGSSYSALRRLGNRPGDINSLEFQLPEYVEQGLTPEQSVEKMADYFSKISAEYLPLDIAQLPVQIQHFLENEQTEELPILQEYEVYARIKKAKKPKSSVNGDIPVKLVKEFSVELTSPVTIIYNYITKSQTFPQ